MSHRMRHVVYRSIGVAAAALGAAKKIDLTKSKVRRRHLVTLGGVLEKTTGSWSRRSGTCFAPGCRGEICPTASVHGSRSTLDGGDGVRVASGRGSSRSLPGTRQGSCVILIARTLSFTSTEPTRRVGRRSKRSAGRREASTRSSPPWWTRWADRSGSAWLPVSSMISKRSFLWYRPSETSMQSPIAASMRRRSTRHFASPMSGHASGPSGAEPGATASTEATTDAATEWKTSSAASNASAVSRPAMTSSQRPSSPSFSSPPFWIGSLTGFENTP